MSIFGIGLSGITAAQTGMQVTQHNIANSSTPGYNRQSMYQTPSTSIGTASGFIGNGVRVTTVQRDYSSFLTEQVRVAETQLASMDSYFGQIEVVDNLLADSSAGVSPAIQDFFSAVQQVASLPASLPARQAMVSAAQALSTRFQSASLRISDLYSQANLGIEDNLQMINSYASQIAKLNSTIITAEAAVSQPANDLLDQRDQLIGELNKMVKVQTIPLAGGGIEVLIGKGQLLVMGDTAYEMSTMRDPSDPSKTTIALDLGSGPQQLPENVITGGKLGGLLAFRTETLDSAMNSLGKVAASLALAFNTQHQTGMDMLGNSATVNASSFVSDFFTIPDPKVIPADAGYPTLSAAFTPLDLTSKLAGGNYFTNLANSDYNFSFNGSEYTLTRLKDNVEWKATSVAALNTLINDASDSRGAQGFTLAGAGFSAGQSYTIQPTRLAAGNISVDARVVADVRLIAAALPYRAAVGLSNAGSVKAAIERVREDTTSPVAPATSPSSYPVTFRISATGKLTVTSPVAPATLNLNVIDSSGNLTTESINSTTPSTSSVGNGTAFELWDGTRRIMFSVSGTYDTAGNDTFTISSNGGSATTLGVSDSSNIVALGKLLSQKTTDGATGSFQSAYAQLVADVGNKAREIEVTKDAQQALADQANATKNAVSGVNLDEEAANLLKFQQLYQAAARSISIGQKLFDELLAIARG